jgi:hypothetical protein
VKAFENEYQSSEIGEVLEFLESKHLPHHKIDPRKCSASKDKKFVDSI